MLIGLCVKTRTPEALLRTVALATSFWVGDTVAYDLMYTHFCEIHYTIDISVRMLWWGRSVIWCVCHTGSIHIILLSVYMLLPDPLHLIFLWGCLDQLRLWCFNEMGVRINQDQGQGWVWGWENIIPEAITNPYWSVNWFVCQNQDSRSIIENGSTGHILLGGWYGGLRLNVYALLWDSLQLTFLWGCFDGLMML